MAEPPRETDDDPLAPFLLPIGTAIAVLFILYAVFERGRGPTGSWRRRSGLPLSKER